jgi:cation diffusion facilitator family transporter
MYERPNLSRYAYLSIAAALLTIILKTSAFFITGSIGLLSDALESVVNLVAAVSALAAIRISAKPPDEDHSYGHQKVEYLSSGAEGGLILMAAVSISIAAIQRLLNPIPLEQVNLGLMISLSASLINLLVARVLIRIGRSQRSIALEADGHHLMTDVWTSLGILFGIGVVSLTGWYVLDPIVALVVAIYISFSGIKLLRRSASGLMDTALPDSDIQTISRILERHCDEGIAYHALRTRQSGFRSFISFQVQVPGAWTVQAAHNLLEVLEEEIREAIPYSTVFTHVEPVEDPRSWQDQMLDRPD